MSRKLPQMLEPPAHYIGPIWYLVSRTFHNHSAKVPFSIPSKLSQRLFGNNSGRRVLTSGEVVDGGGHLLKPFDQPVVCKAKTKVSCETEFIMLGDCTIVSARVHDAIVALDSSPFIFVALDVHTPGEMVDRWYAMYLGETARFNILDPATNNLKRISLPDEAPRYEEPHWLSLAKPHFGYLRPDVVGGRHLLATWAGTPIMSADLAEQVRDAFNTDYAFLPLGVA